MDCEAWREVLQSGGPVLLSAAHDVVRTADRGRRLEALARSLIRAVAVARTQPSASLRLEEVEHALKLVAAHIEEELPPPTRRRA